MGRRGTFVKGSEPSNERGQLVIVAVELLRVADFWFVAKERGTTGRSQCDDGNLRGVLDDVDRATERKIGQFVGFVQAAPERGRICVEPGVEQPPMQRCRGRLAAV